MVGLGQGTTWVCSHPTGGCGPGAVMHRRSKHHTLINAALKNTKKCDLSIVRVKEQNRTRKTQRYKTHIHWVAEWLRWSSR